MWERALLSACGPRPLKRPSGRFHQRSRPALIMQMCNRTLKLKKKNRKKEKRHTQKHPTTLRPSPPASIVAPAGHCYSWLGPGRVSVGGACRSRLIGATSKTALKRGRYLLGTTLTACHKCVSAQSLNESENVPWLHFQILCPPPHSIYLLFVVKRDICLRSQQQS